MSDTGDLARRLSAALGTGYIVERLLGAGGFASVFLVSDLSLKRSLAVKVLSPDMITSRTVLERFRREAETVAQLSHPNIVPLHFIGQQDELLYLAMQCVDGGSIADRLEREHALPLEDAVRVMCEVASALAHAHKHGVVHRDIKPANVLVDSESGRCLVTDFGIARTADGGTLTATGMLLGTPAYLSPEQVTGEIHDHRVDIFALGVMAYEMLAGRLPFDGPTPLAAMMRRLAGPPEPLSTIRPEVPAPIAGLIERCLATEPARRFQTADEVVSALERISRAGFERPARGQTAPVMAPGSPAGLSAATQPARRRLRARIGLAVALVGLGAGMTWLARDVPFVAGLLSRGPHVRILAVLPLVNLTGDVQQEYYADGLTAALINDLSQLPGVKVISRTSVMQYKMMKKPMREIARELNADAVLEGSLQREGERMRITATLVRGADEQNLWTQSYDGRVGELFDLQRTVGLGVAREIGARFALRSSPRHAAVKPESQDAYLKGTYYAGQGAGRLEEAIASFQKAVEVDPTNAPAYAALARAYYFRAFFGDVAPREAFSQMRRAAAAALAQDSLLGEAHGLMALVNTHFDFDWVAAERNFGEALRLSPSNAQVHHDYAHFLLAMGRGPESVEESRRAVELDPANPMLTACLGWHNLFDQRFDQSLKYAAEAQRLMPDFWALVVQGWAQSGEGLRAEAVASMREAVALKPELGFTQSALAHALARNGETREAREVLARLLEQARNGYVSAYDLAIVYTGLGNNDLAFEWLGKAVAERSMFVVHLTWDARLQPLHADRRFGEFVQRLAIPAVTPPERGTKAVAAI